ncbi:aldehyde ferredoxin oxidoreductase family protein [Chloroflexota bacterium]
MAKQYGYTGKILRVDLSSGQITHISTMDYANTFVGGKGIAEKIYWDEVSPDVGAFDPENRLVFMTGPLTGFPGLSTPGFKVCQKSPISIPEQFTQCNLGGSWGTYLKFAGFDGIVVHGKSDKPVFLLVQDDVAELRDASNLWGKGAIEVREALKREFGRSLRVVACGPAGENMVVFANLLADEDASGSGGSGAVMGSKKLKAIAVRGSRQVTAANPEKLGQYIKYIRESIGSDTITLNWAILPRMRERSTLPYSSPKMKRQICYGCGGNGCVRATYEADDGKRGKFLCGSGFFYGSWIRRYYGHADWEAQFRATNLCDNYGIDSLSFGRPMLSWLWNCYEAGILTDENTGIPLSRIGTPEFIETLVRKISLREGFGDTLALGLARATEVVGKGSKELVHNTSTDSVGDITPLSLRTQETIFADPRLYVPVALLYALALRIPKHEYMSIVKLQGGWLSWVNHEDAYHGYISSDVWRAVAKRFMGSELAADFSTYEGKALAVKMIQDREAISQSLITCMYIWPIMAIKNSEDHMADQALESKVLSVVTGEEVDEQKFNRIGEAIYNLERAIRLREGHMGRESDTIPEFYFTKPLKTTSGSPECLVPGKDGEVISRKGEVVDRAKFEEMKNEYYQIRGWDVANGLPTMAKFEELGLADVARYLDNRGLIVTPHSVR